MNPTARVEHSDALPVEFDAACRAKLVLNQLGLIQAGTERAAVSQLLNAAGWTYVAAFISSLIYLLRHLLPLLGRGNALEAVGRKTNGPVQECDC